VRRCSGKTLLQSTKKGEGKEGGRGKTKGGQKKGGRTTRRDRQREVRTGKRQKERENDGAWGGRGEGTSGERQSEGGGERERNFSEEVQRKVLIIRLNELICTTHLKQKLVNSQTETADDPYKFMFSKMWMQLGHWQPPRLGLHNSLRTIAAGSHVTRSQLKCAQQGVPRGTHPPAPAILGRTE
jgi:hypothetical protein